MITARDTSQSDQRYISKPGEAKAMPQNTSSGVPADPRQVAEYSASMLASLRDMAADSGLTFLAYLIQVAVEEAKIQAAGDPLR
jgi:hypothetical protein